MKYLLLILIITLGAILRLALLETYPISLFRDEAALGFNAFSILKTGRDEYGMILPVVFRSFEVFFLPLYVYLSTPIMALLGLTIFSSRFVSAISGVFTLLLIYLICKKGWPSTELWSSFFLAISPWHIYYSRGAFEGNLGLSLFSAGFLFWLVFLDSKKTKHFFGSVVLFALSMYCYQAERVVVPLFAIFAGITSFRLLWELRKNLYIPLLITFVLLIPLIALTLQPGGYHRASEVSIFSRSSPPPGSGNPIFLRIRQISALYLAYFSPRNLFSEGDYDQQRSVKDFSVFYVFMFPLLLIGAWQLVTNLTTQNKLLGLWILLAPLPAALTKDPFHTYRSLLLYLPLIIIMSVGITKNKSWLLSAIIVFFSMASMFQFIYNYAALNSVEKAGFWDYGYSQIFATLSLLPKGTPVVIDDPGSTPYIHILFHQYVSVRDYQKSALAFSPIQKNYYSSSDKLRPVKVGSVEFRHVDWPTERGDLGKVFVIMGKLLPESEYEGDPHVQLLSEIYYPDGSIAFRIVKIVN